MYLTYFITESNLDQIFIKYANITRTLMFGEPQGRSKLLKLSSKYRNYVSSYLNIFSR